MGPHTQRNNPDGLPTAPKRPKPLNVGMLRGPAETNEEVRKNYLEAMEELATDEDLPADWAWEDMAKRCTKEMEKLAGRGRLVKGTPYMDGHHKQVVEGRERMRNLQKVTMRVPRRGKNT